MHIEREHHVSQQEAKAKIDTFLSELMHRDFPGGVKIKDPVKHWHNDVMEFSFKAKKGFVGTSISGNIRVDDRTVVMDSELPGVVKAIVSEDKVCDVINRQFDSLFHT